MKMQDRHMALGDQPLPEFTWGSEAPEVETAEASKLMRFVCAWSFPRELARSHRTEIMSECSEAAEQVYRAVMGDMVSGRVIRVYSSPNPAMSISDRRDERIADHKLSIARGYKKYAGKIAKLEALELPEEGEAVRND